MKGILAGVSMVIFFASFTGERQDLYPPLKNTSFGKGEVLDYRVNFGIFTVGHAETKIDSKTFWLNSRPCYKIDAFGTTSGVVAWLSKVDDQWGAYIDTAALVTHVSYRKLKEGNFRRDEIVTFDHEKKKAEVKLMNKETGVYDNIKYYPVERNVRDIVAGFMYLRVLDFSKHKKGDTLRVAGFFEDTSYILKIIYDGKEVVNSHVGKIMCHRIIPIVPDNKLFNGENSVTAWFSDDGNRIPVKIQAKMFIGSTGLELVSFRGLRNQLKIVQ
jgi:hypothetical protein